MATSFEFAFHDEGATEFLKSLVKNTGQVSDPSDLYIGAISSQVFSDVIDHFKKQSGPEGSWKPWSKMYAAHMKKIGRENNMILQFNGRLRNSFQPTNTRKVNQGILWFNNAKTAKGFPYAQAHDQGGSTPGRPPQRQFMWLSSNAMKLIEKTTIAYIMGER